MPGLIIEGPDGSGKSTMAEFLSSAMGIPQFHSGGPPKDLKDLLERSFMQLRISRDHIIDRCSLISDYVYGETIRDGSWFSLKWLELITVPIIYCRPSDETLALTYLRTKEHKDTVLINKVISSRQKIINLYDRVFEYISEKGIVPVLYYNRDKTPLGEFIPCVESILRTENHQSGT